MEIKAPTQDLFLEVVGGVKLERRCDDQAFAGI